MERVPFDIDMHAFRAADAAIVLADEDPLQAMIEATIETISIEVYVTCGGVQMHLAAWRDPDHWQEDWAAKGLSLDDVHALVEGATTTDG